jgi:hypothetical protein
VPPNVHTTACENLANIADSTLHWICALLLTNVWGQHTFNWPASWMCHLYRVCHL